MGKRVVEFVKEYWTYSDVALAFVAGIVISVLGLLDVVEGDALTQATVAVLSVLAFSLLHDRVNRESRMKKLETAVADAETDMATKVAEMGTKVTALSRDIRRSVDDLTSDWPYHQDDLAVTWDLETRDRGVQTKLKRLRFTRNNVTSIMDRGDAAGEVSAYRIYGNRPGRPPVELELFGRELLDDDDRPIQLVALDRPWKLGEVMELRVERTLIDSFPKSEEVVGVLLTFPTDSARVTVIWPPDEEPTDVWIKRRIGDRVERTDVELADLVRRADSRVALEDYEVADAGSGGLITITWRW